MLQLHLTVNEMGYVHVNLQPIETVQKKGVVDPRQIQLKDVDRLVEQLRIPECLDIHMRLLDQSRIHPRYARVLQRNQSNEYHSYTALSFIGDAFVNFVASILVYQEFGMYSKKEKVIYPLCSSGTLTELVNSFKRNAFLAERTKALGWDKFLVHNQKQIQAQSKKGEKALADMLEGLIGCLYSSNGNEKIPEICEVVKNMIMPNSEYSFLQKSSNHWDWHWNYFTAGFMLCAFVIGCLGFFFPNI